MAVSSITTLIPSLATSNSLTLPSKTTTSVTKLSPLFYNTFRVLKPSVPTKGTVFAAPEALNSQETLDPRLETLDETSSEMAPKQKIRIKLRSYWVPLIEDSCKQIIDAAKNTNAKTMGPVPLPTKKRVYCVLKSPHVHKDARFHFEIRTHQRLIDILQPTAQTIDSLMQLDLPAGVDVEVKL